MCKVGERQALCFGNMLGTFLEFSLEKHIMQVSFREVSLFGAYTSVQNMFSKYNWLRADGMELRKTLADIFI